MEEEQVQTTGQSNNESGLRLTNLAISYLREIGKWAKFLSIIGFIGAGVMMVIGLFAISEMQAVLDLYRDASVGVIPSVSGVMYVLIGVIFLTPSWYMFKFSQKLKTSLRTEDSNELEIALLNQKSFFKFWGILMIVVLGFYLLLAVFGLLAYIVI
ncbi:MAG: hypothetical protein HRT66_07910 [Flavobacteriaceae bacterium]|nr:hypothetical protein [Flavobacteriaceae bacterium]